MCIRADLAGRLAPTCARRRARFRRRQTASPITRRSYVVVASTAPRFGFTFAPPGATPRPQRRPMGSGSGRVVKWSYTGSDVKVAHTVSTDARHARAGCWPRRAPRQGAAAGAVLRPSPLPAGAVAPARRTAHAAHDLRSGARPDRTVRVGSWPHPSIERQDRHARGCLCPSPPTVKHRTTHTRHARVTLDTLDTDHSDTACS